MPSECLARFKEGGESLLWIWLIGFGALVFLITSARIEHAKKAGEGKS
jgi:hypothetical protein